MSTYRLPLLLVMLVANPALAQVEFNVSFDATAAMLTPAERGQVESHLREAGRHWAQAMAITGARSIELRVGIAAIPTANGASLTTVFVGVINGRNTFEQGAAAELRTGADPNGADPDGHINFGLDYLRNELWFDPDPIARTAPVPANRTHAMSVALHELGHVIAYNGWADLNTGVPPATFWSTFDRWMQPGAPTLFLGPGAVQSWGVPPDLTTGNNKHWGNPAAGAPPGVPQRLPQVQWRYGAPVPFPACSLPLTAQAPPSHDRESSAAHAGGTLIDEPMNGVVFFRGTRYDITPLDRATLIDLGLLNDLIFAGGFQ
jgi:hypothetical protein